jgi:flagellar basal body-associated protein FliL
MDLGGFNLALIEIIFVAVLGLAMLYAVSRTKSRGKRDSNPTTERATKAVYAEEERARRDGTEGDA